MTAKPDVTVDASNDDRRLSVRADRGLLARVIDNLLFNAIRHSDSGGGIRLTVSDVETPQIDGLALTCAIRNREETSDLPVIMYSSIGDLGMKKRAEFLKASAHITKLNVEELLEKVTELTTVTGSPELVVRQP